MTTGRNPQPGDRVPPTRAQRSSSSRGAGRHPRQRAGLQAFQGLLASTGWTAGTWTSSPYGDVSYDGSADVAPLDVNGNPIQDQLSSANCLQSPPVATAAPLLGRGAGPTP
jgi:hypothetical protein